MEPTRQNVALLDRARALVTGLDAAVYAGAPGTSGVGAHLRHCLDFYRALLRAIDEAGAGPPRIDYDRRDRTVPIEQDPRAGLRELGALRDALRALGVPADTPVLVRADPVAGGPGEPGGAWQGSTLGRELLFLASHTIHHFATIAALLRAEGIEPGDDFGVAPSTLAYRSGTECAR